MNEICGAPRARTHVRAPVLLHTIAPGTRIGESFADTVRSMGTRGLSYRCGCAISKATKLSGRALMLGGVIACGLALVSCGGPLSKAEYEAQVDAIARQANTEIGETLDSTGPPEASDLKRAATTMRTAADDLAEIDPPDEVAEAHKRMIRGMRGLGTWFDDLATDVQDLRSDRERADLLLSSAESEKAREAFEDVRWSQRTFKRAGYKVFDAAEEASQGVTAANP